MNKWHGFQRRLVFAICLCSLGLGSLTARQALASFELSGTWNPGSSSPPFWSISPSQLLEPTPTNWDVDGIPTDLLGNTLPVGYPSHVFIPDIFYYYRAEIGPKGQADVTLNGLLTVSLDQLQMTNGSTLSIPETAGLVLTGRPGGRPGLLDSNGTVFLTGGDNLSSADIAIDGTVTFTGGGTVSMASGSNNRIVGSVGFSPQATLIIEDHTIEGAGQIGVDGLAIRNLANGVIRANKSANELVIDPGDNNNLINDGLLEATNGGALRIRQTAVVNTNGVIQADSAGSVVYLQDVTVSGGTLAGSGAIRGEGLVTLEAPQANNATYVVTNGSTTIVDGNLPNNGLVSIAGGSLLFDGSNEAGGQVTLSGGGTVTLAAVPGSALGSVSGTTTSLLNVDNLIQGAGVIALDMINQSVIRADESGATLDFILGQTVNQGLVEASGGGRLSLRSMFDNTAGQLNARGGTIIVRSGGVIDGGVVTIDSGGRLELADGATSGAMVSNLGGVIATSGFITNRLDGQILNAAGGVIQVNDSDGLVFDQASTYTNSGVIELNGSGPASGFSTTELLLDGVVTLDGGGEVVLSNSSANVIQSFAGGDDTLVNNDNWIHGAGQIGRNATTLVNHGLISADRPVTAAAGTGVLEIDPGNGGMDNDGVMEATGGGTLRLRDGHYRNAGGEIRAAAGSTVDLVSGAVVEGGRLGSTGSGQIRVDANNVTFDATGGMVVDANVQVGSAGRLRVLGGLENRGRIDVAGQGQLQVDGPVTLTGGGVVNLAAPDSRLVGYPGSVPGDQLINVDNTITGSGTILFLDLVNNGVISPGNSPGTLTIQGAFTQGATGLLEIELAGTGAGQFDILNISGNALLGGGLQVSLLDGFLPEIGDTFDFLLASAVDGTFDPASVFFPTFSGRTFALEYGANFVRLTTVASAVPLPPALWSFAGGVLAFLAMARRKA